MNVNAKNELVYMSSLVYLFQFGWGIGENGPVVQ